jgi:predicted kinase
MVTQGKKLIIVCGLPGTGKSTLSEGLAAALRAPLLSVDPIESSIIKAGIQKTFETGLAAYLVVETLAAEQLKLGQSAIIDAVSPVKEARALWHKLSKTYEAPLVIFECVLDPALHKQRIASRVRSLHGIPEVTWEDVEHRRKEYLPWSEERLVLDSADTVEHNIEKSLTYCAKN